MYVHAVPTTHPPLAKDSTWISVKTLLASYTVITIKDN